MRHREQKRVISDIGRRIAELRAARGWTQEQFAERLKMAPQNLARLEQGRSDFRISTLVRVAGALDQDVRALFEVPAIRTPARPGRPRTPKVEATGEATANKPATEGRRSARSARRT